MKNSKTVAIPTSSWTALRHYCADHPGLTLGDAIAQSIALFLMAVHGGEAPEPQPSKPTRAKKAPNTEPAPAPAPEPVSDITADFDHDATGNVEANPFTVLGTDEG